MDHEITDQAPHSRLHVVLVPGFAGFDALGQLDYYSGVTPLFDAWTTKHPDARGRVVLHYFDNFPTAAVVTRAARLRAYLAKRIKRGEFAGDDRVVLVGHSTAGLDIRQLLWDLSRNPDEKIPVDSDSRSILEVHAHEILDKIRAVVFLSVPHEGTATAEWVRTYWLARKIVVAELRAAVFGSQWPPVDAIEKLLAGAAGGAAGAELLYAVRDSLAEADAGLWPHDPIRTASAHECASQLALWLRHMASDFNVINDLAPTSERELGTSPAHFDSATRDREKQAWTDLGIDARSYATLGRRPFDFGHLESAPLWDLAKPWTYPDFTRSNLSCSDTDFVYRACYRACAGTAPGPIVPAPLPPPLNERLAAVIAEWNVSEIEAWDSDGIVNTRSMLRPPVGPVVLVPADHMDIVGHYQLVPVRQAEGAQADGRRYHTYDLLKSQSQFGDQTFAEVWDDVLDFAVACVRAPLPAAREAVVTTSSHGASTS